MLPALIHQKWPHPSIELPFTPIHISPRRIPLHILRPFGPGMEPLFLNERMTRLQDCRCIGAVWAV